MIAEAKDILEKSFQKGEAESFEFANYGGVLAIQGELESSQTYLEIAGRISFSDHAKAITLLNQGILECARGDTEKKDSLLREAIRLSPRVEEYFEYSIIISGITATESVVNEQAGVPQAT